MERTLTLVPVDSFYFDDFFSQADRQVARRHQDMRNAMQRLAPRPLVSSGSAELRERLRRLQDAFRPGEDGSRHLDLALDVSGFQPGEIEVSADQDGVLSVQAEHEERSGGSYMRAVFRRHIRLPQGTDVDQLLCSLHKDAVLTIKGPVAGEAAETLPIAQEGK